MKNTVLRKIFIVVYISLIISICFAPVISNAIENPGDYNPGRLQESDVGSFLVKVNVIFGIIQLVGSIVSVGALMFIGIKYMIGSIEEKAEYKKALWPYIIGAILLFAASNLVQVVYKIFIHSPRWPDGQAGGGGGRL
jgi:sterol desaturase/sphingolipid hydroxylase (fatty acid hydroxylase superfamily)